MRHSWLALPVVVLVITSGAVASANLVSNPGFESGDFSGWTPSGNTDFTFVNGLPHSGEFAAWFGPPESPGFVSQTLTTVPGETYELRYWLQHDPFGSGTPNVVQVSWGGSLIANDIDVGAFPYTEFVFRNLVPTGASTELRFGFREDTDFFQLDDVLVQAVSRAIPEPATLLVFGVGLLILIACGPRRRTVSAPWAWARALTVGTALAWCALGAAPAHAEITDFTPKGIRAFLTANPQVVSKDQFLQNLPLEFHYNWIMMTRTESAQEGTATRPRFILFDLLATRVFGFDLTDSQTIEYLQFEETTNKFRFHEITLKPAGGGEITIDDVSCRRCHASRRAEGLPRPNWDAYDSWGGALPFNRDRIYQNSEEEKAVTRILNDIKNTPFGLQLGFPPGIQDDVTTGTIKIDYTNCDPGIDTTDDPCKTDPGNRRKYLRVQSDSPGKGTKTDEGRAVALFDLFTAYNARRIGQELVDFPRNPVDIRPVALAIANDCVSPANLGKYAPKAALIKLLAHHTRLDPAIKTFQDLIADTQKRMESLPKLKADLQIENLKGLIAANGSAADPNTEIALRSRFNPSETFELDKLTGFMIDREFYGPFSPPNRSEPLGNEVLNMALFRLFLEPLGVAVDMWSMSVRSTRILRNRTYTFGDLFQRVYIPVLTARLASSLGGTPTCSSLSAASIRQYVRPF